MKLQWAVGLVIFLGGGAGWAQEARPSVTPYPLEMRRAPQLTELEAADLQTAWRRLLRTRALAPDAVAVDEALRESGRRDCEREDACLAALAVKAKTLYAAYGAVGLDVTGGKVVATGRVVRDDGKAMGELRTVQVDLGPGFVPSAKDALGKLVEALGVGALSPVRPVEQPRLSGEPTRVGPSPVPGVEAAPARLSGRKVASFVVLGAGVVAAGVGIGLLGGAEGEAAGLIDVQGRVTAPDSQETRSRLAGINGQRAGGGVLLGVGAAAVATGVLLFALAGSEAQVAVGVAPTGGGAVLGVAGVW